MLGESGRLGAIFGRRIDVDHRVLRRDVGRQRGAPNAGPERLDERATLRDDERGVVPVRVRRVRSAETEPLADLDQPREELASMREYEVARARVGHGLPGR